MRGDIGPVSEINTPFKVAVLEMYDLWCDKEYQVPSTEISILPYY